MRSPDAIYIFPLLTDNPGQVLERENLSEILPTIGQGKEKKNYIYWPEIHYLVMNIQ